MKIFKRLLILLAVSLPLGLAMPAYVQAGTFPGANGRIAFTTNRDGNDEIYSMNPDGSDPVNLTNHPGKDRAASWSADGSKIAFQSNRHGDYGIYTMNADGSNQTLLTGEFNDTLPSWSADGSKIAFVRDPAGAARPSQIYTMNADGSNQVNISNSSARDSTPSWSPDGTKIIFSSALRSEFPHFYIPPQLYTMNPDGTDKERLGDYSFRGSKWNASWSPDGTKLAYQRSAIRGSEVFIANSATGEDVGRLLDPDVYASVAPSGAWSPDGTKITYSSHGRIYTAGTDGSNPSKISNTSPPVTDSEPVWQPLRPAKPEPNSPSHVEANVSINVTGSDNNFIKILFTQINRW